MTLQSLSSLERAEHCPPSAVLMHFDGASEPADEGSAIHEHMHMRAALGVDEAMARLPKVLAKWGVTGDRARIVAWRCRSFTWSPPRSALGEVALGLRRDGTVVRVKGGRGKYDLDPKEFITAGTIDLLWAEPEPLIIRGDEIRCPTNSVLWVDDYKTGDDGYVTPIEHNTQLAGEAFLAAKWTGAQAVMPAITFIEPGHGTWDTPDYAWGHDDIKSAELRIRMIVSRVEAEAKHIENGGVPRTREGRWCDFCAAQNVCPSKIGLLKAALGDPEPVLPNPLTPEQERLLASHVSQLGRMYSVARSYLERVVAERGHPIDLGNGFVWGPVTSERKEIDPTIALETLQRELQHHIGEALSVSKSGIERAVKMLHLEKGIARQVAPTMRRILGELEKKDAFKPYPYVEHRVHRRLPVLPTRADDDAQYEDLPIEGDAPWS